MNMEHVLTNKEVDQYLNQIKGEYEKAKDNNTHMTVTLNVEMAQKLSFCLLELQVLRKLVEIREFILTFPVNYFLTEKEGLRIFKIFDNAPNYLLTKEDISLHKSFLGFKYIQNYLKSK